MMYDSYLDEEVGGIFGNLTDIVWLAMEGLGKMTGAQQIFLHNETQSLRELNT